jgi:ribose transport system permease protein
MKTVAPEDSSKLIKPAQQARPAWMRRFLSARETGVFLALLIMCIFLSITSPVFLKPTNLLNIGRQVSLLGIMAIGQTLVLICQEVDLSVGSAYALVGLGVGILLTDKFNLWLAIGLGLAAGALIGLINGWLSTYGQLPSFITTLGMLSVVRGAALLMTNGEPVTVDQFHGVSPNVANQFFFLGQGYLFGIIPMQLVFFVIILILANILLSRTIFGFQVYAVGGNEKAARVSGIRTRLIKIITFIIMGMLAGFAGILAMAFLPTGQAGTTGVGLELDVIAAAIVGGASLSGGEGTMLGALIGVLVIGVMRNGLVLLGTSPFWQEMLIGVVIILVVGIDKWTRRRRTG